MYKNKIKIIKKVEIIDNALEKSPIIPKHLPATLK
jgi:hypothetical protein